jgi:hypothetical protein
MRTARWLVVAIALLGAAAACRAEPIVDGKSSPFPVAIERSGGFAGVRQAMTVQETGAWSYENVKGSATAETGQLPTDQVQAIVRVLTDAGLRGEISDARPDPGCSDAFLYSLTVQGERHVFEDCGKLGPLLQALLTALREGTPF